MEGLARLVSESLARHGFEAPVDHRRLHWSGWFRCESSFSLLLLPSKPGLFALAEELIAPGELPSTDGKRMLALFQLSEADDLGLAMCRLFAPNSPVRHRFADGRCFARYVVIEDDVQRRSAAIRLQKWLASSAETASGVPSDFAISADGVSQPTGEDSAKRSGSSEASACAIETQQPACTQETGNGRSDCDRVTPAPIPSGF